MNPSSGCILQNSNHNYRISFLFHSPYSLSACQSPADQGCPLMFSAVVALWQLHPYWNNSVECLLFLTHLVGWTADLQMMVDWFSFRTFRTFGKWTLDSASLGWILECSSGILFLSSPDSSYFCGPQGTSCTFPITLTHNSLCYLDITWDGGTWGGGNQKFLFDNYNPQELQ